MRVYQYLKITKMSGEAIEIQGPYAEHTTPSRSSKHNEYVLSKVEKMREELDEQIREECSFQPVVNWTGTIRTLEEFLRDQNLFEAGKKKKIADLKGKKEQKFEKEQRANPFTLAGSEKMLPETRRLLPVFEQLYRKSCQKSGDPIEEPVETESFVPNVSPKPRKNKIQGRISDHLYSDAMRRSKRQQNPSAIPNRDVTNKKSNRFVTRKFIKEFSVAYDYLDVDKSLLLPYSLYIVLLSRLSFIRNSPRLSSYAEEKALALRAWKSLIEAGAEEIVKSTLLKFSLSVLNYDNRLGIHSEYYVFYHNKAHCRKDRIDNETYSFKPSLSKQTNKYIANHRKERVDNIEFLHSERQQLIEKWGKTKMDEEKDMLKGLTFTPKTNKTIHSIGNSHKTGSIAYLWKKLRDQDLHDTHRALSLFSLSTAIIEDAKVKAAEEAGEQLNARPLSNLYRKLQQINCTKKVVEEVKGTSESINRIRAATDKRVKLLTLFESTIPNKEKPMRFDNEMLSKFDSPFKGKEMVIGDNPKKKDSATSECMTLTRFLKNHIGSDYIDTTSRTNSESSETPIQSESLNLHITLPSGEMKELGILNEDEIPSALEYFLWENELDEKTDEKLMQCK